MPSATKPNFIRPAHSGFLAGSAVLLALALAGPSTSDVSTVMALVLTAALSVSMSQAGGRTALLSGLCAGLFFGLTSVIGYLTHDMAEKFQPVAASLAVFLILGLLFGSFAEAVRVLHRAIHRPDDLK